MVEIKKIVVPVDFSPPSKKAVDHAISIATAFSADLVLASVIQDPVAAPYFPSAPREPEKVSIDEVQAKLVELVAPMARDALHCRFIAKRGLVDEELVSTIGDERADLVVMGTHGRRAFKRWFLGSVTEHILRRIPAPVLTVSHPEEQHESWAISGGHILYATDLSEGSDRGLQLAYALSQRFDGRLTILHAVHLPVEYGAMYPQMVDHEELKKGASTQLTQSVPEAIRADPKVRVELADGSPYQVILDTADRLHASLIVINLHGKSRTERALLGATAERVVRAAHRPVLSIPLIEAATK